MINDDYDYYPNAMMIDDYIKIISNLRLDYHVLQGCTAH